MLLTDPLDAASAQLLQIIYRGFEPGAGGWPVWQWVRLTASRQGLDADALLSRFPQWGLHYRPVAGLNVGQLPDEGDMVALSILGLAHTDDDRLIPSFLAALSIGAERAGQHEPSPHAVRPLIVNGEELTARVYERTSARVAPKLLRALLEREPATWSGHLDKDGQWLWDLTRPRFGPFEGTTTVDDYLARLDGNLVGIPANPVHVDAPDPLSLLDQFDHLDAEWKIRTGQRLWDGGRKSSVGILVLPVNSAAELELACSALADVMAGMRPSCSDSSVKGSLAQLDHRVKELLQDATVASAAISTLRSINDIRVGQQHSGTKAYTRGQSARRALGLSATSVDWQSDWDMIRSAAIHALRQLRQQVGGGVA